MSTDIRRVRVKAFAKINLNLEVLQRRADGYHEIRTIFHSISLADTLQLTWTAGRRVQIVTESKPAIPGNLVTRAAEALLESTNARGALRISLRKRIPMGAGLGGGSSDAAAVLLALPALTGRPIGTEQLWDLAASIGSDVPFFLVGGCALALGRGEQLYPLEGPGTAPVLVVDPQVHVSTADAYRSLARPLTSQPYLNKIDTSRRVALGMGAGVSAFPASECENDFESVVFKQHPRLKSIKRKLLKLGASCALLSGSGASVFGIFDSREKRDQAIQELSERAFAVSLLSRRKYRQIWRQTLYDYIADDKSWPPLSRYAR